MLRAVAYGWRQETIAENARAISDLGRELYERLAVRWPATSRRSASGSTPPSQAYNQTVGSLERRVLVTARRFGDQGAVGGEIVPLAPIERRRSRRRRRARGRASGAAELAGATSTRPSAARSAAARRCPRAGRGPGARGRAARCRRGRASGGARGRARVVRLELRPVERARAALGAARPHCGHCHAAAERPPGRAGPRHGRRRPPRGSAPAADGAAVAAELLAPALELRRSPPGPARSSTGLDDLEQVGRRRVRLGGRPAGQGLARASCDEQCPRTPARSPPGRRSRPPRRGRRDLPVDLVGDVAQVLGRELVDVALEARLRPAALVVPARLLLAQVGGRLRAGRPQAVERRLLPVHDRARACRRRVRPAARAVRGRNRARP